MLFEWYQEVSNSDELNQGDIIKNCNIPIPNISLYDAILNESSEVEEAIEIKTSDVVILSQACDLVNNKISSVVVCPVWPLEMLIKRNSYYESSKARESLRQGKEPSYHLLKKHDSERIQMDFSVVDFHQIFSLPKDYLQKTVENMDVRIRLLPPYREHLSQAYARYFMRVGLPLDIPRDDIKEYKSS